MGAGAARATSLKPSPRRLRAQLGPGAADVAQILPELESVLHDLPVPPALDPESARFRLFDSMATFLRKPRPRDRSSSCSTTCTRPTSRRSFCCSSWRGELAESRLLVIPAHTATSIRPLGQALSAALTELRRACHASCRARRPRRERRRALHRGHGARRAADRHARRRRFTRRRKAILSSSARSSACCPPRGGSRRCCRARDPAEREGGDRPPAAPPFHRMQPAF